MSQNNVADRTASKLRYSAPKLRVFGDVIKLTANGTKEGVENSGNVFGNVRR